MIIQKDFSEMVFDEEEQCKIYINTSLIPQHTKDTIAAATLDFMRDLLKHPGGREVLDAKKAELFN